MKKLITSHYENALNAKLNGRYDWGSENSKAVYLTIWSDLINGNIAHVLDPADHRDSAAWTARHNQRKLHLSHIAQGKLGFVIVAVNKNDSSDSSPRSIESFDDTVVYRINKIFSKNDEIYIEISDAITIEDHNNIIGGNVEVTAEAMNIINPKKKIKARRGIGSY